MGVRVTAVVVSHDQPTFLSETLLALQQQQRQPDHILVVDTSLSGDCLKIIEAAKLPYISLPTKTKLGASLEAAISAQGENASSELDGASDWLWILHDDSAPEPNALAKLLALVEQAPSVAIAGPKLVHWNNKRSIAQLGLTLTPAGKLFSLVSNQLDQSQHDDSDDVMAVSTAGMLVKTGVYQQLRGLDDSAPPLAADLDFSIRARLAGHRVVVVPEAKVRHAELSLNNQRPKAWLGASNKTALRRAEVHLRLVYFPVVLAALYWIALPTIGLLNAVVRIAQKRPNQVFAEVAASLWGFFTVVTRLTSRGLVYAPGNLKFKQLSKMRASRRQVRTANRAQAELEQSELLIAEFEKGEAAETASVEKGFYASGATWWFLALAALSIPLWPSEIAITGGQMLPLSDSWLDLFQRAGASYQPLGYGFYGPSDPQAWVLLFFGSLTFWAPSLGISLLVFLAKSLAFSGAFWLLSRFTDRTWLRVGGSLVFALSPLLATASAEGRFGAIVLAIGLPWFGYAICRIAGVGVSRLATSQRLSSQQSWSWVGIAGLLLAMIGSAAPNAIPVLILVLGSLALARIKKIGYLVWVGLPLATIFAPFEWFLGVGLGHPLAGLTDPGVPTTSPSLSSIFSWMWFALPVVALLALLQRRFGLALWIWILSLLAVGAAWVVSHLEFAAAQQVVSGSPFANLLVAYLGATLLCVLALDQMGQVGWAKLIRNVLFAGVFASALIMFWSSLVQHPSQLTWSGSATVPAIVKAEYDQGSDLRLLEIGLSTDSKPNEYSVRLLGGNGMQYEDSSVAYENYSAQISESGTPQLRLIAELVGNLVSGNGGNIQDELWQEKIGYVLISQSGSSAKLNDLAVSLDSAPELESVGLTDFGRLWRAIPPAIQEAPAAERTYSFWSLTKGIELAVLALFALLALPSPRGRRRVTRDSSIFDSTTEEVQS